METHAGRRRTLPSLQGELCPRQRHGWHTAQFSFYSNMFFLDINMCRHLIPLEFSKSPVVLRDGARGGAVALRAVPGVDQ